MASQKFTEDELVAQDNLKFKYRDPTNMPVRKNGEYRNRTGNSNGVSKKSPAQGTGARRRSYNTHVH